MEESMTSRNDQEIALLLEDSKRLKEKGAACFHAAEWEKAAQYYQLALNTLPTREYERGEKTDSSGLDYVTSVSREWNGSAAGHHPQQQHSVLEPAKTRAILHSNIGACYYKMSRHSDVVRCCTEALENDPLYIKALQRRATSNESISTWQSLTDAQKDLERILQILPATDPARKGVEDKLRKLMPRIETVQAAETAEMLRKLKDLGNSFLGNFGLSTDNFKFEPNETGGYSMNFTR